MRTSAVFSHKSDHWATPGSAYEALDAEFRFTLDPCPLGESDQCNLMKSWRGERVYCNPPYSEIPRWLAKSHEADVAVYLLPSRTGTRWFHEQVLPIAAEIRFLRGRLKFPPATTSAPFDSLVAIFRAVPMRTVRE